MEKSQILSKKRRGDLKLVAEKLGISIDNASQIIKRESSKRHNQVVEELRKVIERREKYLENELNKS